MPANSENSDFTEENRENRGILGESEHGPAPTGPAPNQQPEKEVDVAPAKRTTAPAFQFYPKDFLTSPKVMQMTATERGIYITLLCVCWMEGGLPDNIKQLASLARVPSTQLARLWPNNLQSCFTLVRNGRLINDRLELERKKQIEYRERQALNGKKGGRRPGLTVANPPPSTRVMESEDRRSSSLKEERKGDVPNDVAYAAFKAEYPAARRKGGRMVEESFLHALAKAGGAHKLMAALANHKASEQWQNPRLIPGMDTWLDEERWDQVLPSASVQASPAKKLFGSWRPAEAS